MKFYYQGHFKCQTLTLHVAKTAITMSCAQISFKLMLQASMQAPDGMGAINSAFTGLKCTNWDLFVPICWLWDISELQNPSAKLEIPSSAETWTAFSREGCAWALKRKKKIRKKARRSSRKTENIRRVCPQFMKGRTDTFKMGKLTM